MSSEKHNNPSGLKDKLDTLSFLPEEARMDKNELWESVYLRLHKKPGRKPVGWYRAVAACLLLAVSLALWMKTNTKEHNDIPLSKGSSRATTSQGKKDIRPALVSSPVKIRKPERPAPGKKKLLIEPARLSDPKVTETNMRVQDSGLSVASIEPSMATAAKTIPDPLKKKLRVVHLNEIDEPLEENDFANNTDRHWVRVKWFEQPHGINTSPQSGRSRDEILKINLSPN